MSEMLSPLAEFVAAAMKSFVSWAQAQEWICSKTLFLVTPGEGLDAKAIELADAAGLDSGTFKVCPRLDRRGGDLGARLHFLDAHTQRVVLCSLFFKMTFVPAALVCAGSLLSSLAERLRTQGLG